MQHWTLIGCSQSEREMMWNPECDAMRAFFLKIGPRCRLSFDDAPETQFGLVKILLSWDSGQIQIL